MMISTNPWENVSRRRTTPSFARAVASKNDQGLLVEATAMDSMHPPVIFLDIDGVLVPDGEGVPSCHQFAVGRGR